MRRLPVHVPDVYVLHQRIVDTEGYVNVSRNRYSVPWRLMGRQVEVRESKERIDALRRPSPRRNARTRRRTEQRSRHVGRASAAAKRGRLRDVVAALEERRLAERMPETTPYVALLRSRGRGHNRDLRWLLRMVDEYPRGAAPRAPLREALRYGLADLERLERMVLRRIAKDFFVLRPDAATDPETTDD